MTLETRPVHEADLPRLLAMLTRAYHTGREDFPNDPSILAAYSHHDPESGPSNWVVLFDGDRPASALRIFYRRVRTRRGTFSIGGIGNVGTDPDSLRRGLATRVMETAHARLRAENVDTAVLVTDIPAFYERLGYRSVPQREIRGEGSPRAGEAADSPLVSPVPARVVAWHAQASDLVSGRIERTRALWDEWILAFKVAKGALDARVSPEAYLIGRIEDEGRSYRFLEGGGDSAALAATCVAAARGAGTWKAPDDPLFREVFLRHGMQLSERARTGIMALPLHPAAATPEELGGFLELDTF